MIYELFYFKLNLDVVIIKKECIYYADRQDMGINGNEKLSFFAFIAFEYKKLEYFDFGP